MKIKKIIQGIIALTMIAGSICAVAETTGIHTVMNFMRKHPTCNNSVSMLFVQQARSISFKPTKNVEKTNCYNITLHNTKHRIMYFSDQPKRMSGHINNYDYLKMWKKNRTRPNVAIEAFYQEGDIAHEVTAIATLSKPNYNHKADTFSYLACLETSKKNVIRHPEMVEVTLFVDPFHGWPP